MSGTGRLVMWLGTWGSPVDSVARWAAVVGFLLAFVALSPRRWLSVVDPPTERARAALSAAAVPVLAFVAAFLSLGYIAFYLRSGPRIIDATSYYLEGRVLSHGHCAWPFPSPRASFDGRFFVSPAPGLLAVIFPPGFPLLLAAGFRLGAPLVVGPLLAGALVFVTYGLAGELAPNPAAARPVALLAGALSVVCVALRYHTADTMAHAASALGVGVALLSALRARRSIGGAWWFVAGLAAGWVVCTRPVSSLAVAPVIVLLAVARRRPWRSLSALTLGVLPGLTLLILANHAQTGRWMTSAQAAYYAVSDGPAGCFRYGFGAAVGCTVEHKEFVAQRLANGYGAVEAMLTTLRRLRVHLLDVANLEPLALLVLLPGLTAEGGPSGRTSDRVRVSIRAATCVVVGQIFAYAPFYFDGDYPGGGARFFADVLPVEHALLAVAIAGLPGQVAFFRRALLALSFAALGFAFHGAFEHAALADRDGGQPMFDGDDLKAALPSARGLLFFDSDHGFNLAYDPFADPTRSILAARYRGDDHDRVLVERLDHPQTNVYRRVPRRASVSPWRVKSGATWELWRFESEAEWPPFSQVGGWVEPVWASHSCASDGRVLTLHVDPRTSTGGTSSATIDLPVPRPGRWLVTPRVLRRGGKGRGRLTLHRRGSGNEPDKVPLVWEWADEAPDGPDTCTDLAPPSGAYAGVDLDIVGASWELTATGGDVSLDKTTLKAVR